MSRHAAVALPPGCRTLSDEEAERLDRVHPSSWKKPRSGCRTCEGREFYLAPDGLEWDCDCRTQWKMHRWLLNAGIGHAYQIMNWKDACDVDINVIAKVSEYLDACPAILRQGLGMTFWSSRGTGKTMIAVLLLKALMAEHGVDGYFVQFNDMLDMSADGWRDAQERAWFTRRIRNADVLVIDDIGRESNGRDRTGIVEALVDQVVRHRVASNKPTIITTNYKPEEMHSKYGPNVLSLLSEVNQEVHFPGVDWRQNANQRKLDEARRGIHRPIVAQAL